ncbi:MAG: ELWxxDGT repeat protein [Chitinophagales bacterium]
MNKVYFTMIALMLAVTCFSQTFTPIDVASGAYGSRPQQMCALGNKIIFSATSPANGRELWISDGTSAGTSMVKDIVSGTDSSSPDRLVTVGSKVFFAAHTPGEGTELWVTDGTAVGTMMVGDINPGPSNSGPGNMTAFNGKLFFTANDGTHGNELWISDGTPGGTSLLKDIRLGPGSSDPMNLAMTSRTFINRFFEFNGKLYFTANDSIHGGEMWRTDGTSLGTQMVVDATPGPGNGGGYLQTIYNNKMIMLGNDSAHGLEIWVSDGTSAGTSLLKDIITGTDGSYAGYYSGFTEFGGKLFFTGNSAGNGFELWQTDGTTSGTTQVIDIWPGPGNSIAGAYGIVNYHGKMYFAATDSVHGIQLWSSDGTASGTSMFKNLSPYRHDAFPFNWYGYNGLIWFTASTDTIAGRQLYASNGTVAGTTVMAPAVAPNLDPLGNGFPDFATIPAGLALTANWNSIGQELWIISGINTGIEDLHSDLGLAAMPNPFNDHIMIGGLLESTSYQYQIVDMRGVAIAGGTLNSSENHIAAADFPRGVYLLKVTNEMGTQTFKVTRQ